MNIEQFRRSDDRFVRRYEYEDGVVIVADLGPGSADGSVDVVDGTVIVVPNDADGSQIELDVDDDDARAFIKNGVVTIELEP